jgi:hypothetical protein
VSLRPLAVVDLDGVVADLRARLAFISDGRKDWDGFFAGIPDDPPLPEGLAVAHRLAEDHDVIYLTGRPERTRADTEAWLQAHGLPRGRLIMRRDGDRRPARQVKPRLLERLARGRIVAVVVDDDLAVCDALRAAGWPVMVADWMGRPAPLADAQESDGRT